eukprot:scaffold348881_cov13-Prasinocladus_malaysianus.AAC.1
MAHSGVSPQVRAAAIHPPFRWRQLPASPSTFDRLAPHERRSQAPTTLTSRAHIVKAIRLTALRSPETIIRRYAIDAPFARLAVLSHNFEALLDEWAGLSLSYSSLVRLIEQHCDVAGATRRSGSRMTGLLIAAMASRRPKSLQKWQYALER